MLTNLSRRLIEAQEQERRRIARDLHDDINQRLALLGVKMGALKRHPPLSQEQLLERLRDLSERITDIANGIHAISHKLHSSQLDYLGLVSAVEGLCTEFSSQQHVEIDFEHHDVPMALPQAVSLCLFRVLQETLRNAVKHSGSTSFEVKLWGASGKVYLTVRDTGVGFDVRAAQKATGTGLDQHARARPLRQWNHGDFVQAGLRHRNPGHRASGSRHEPGGRCLMMLRDSRSQVTS